MAISTYLQGRYEKQKAKYVYTWEVFGDLKAHNDDVSHHRDST